MKERKKIVDTTLRDGEQQPGVALRPEDKLKLALMLDRIGVYEIEAGTPSLGMGEEEYIQELMRQKKNAIISVWSRANIEDIKYAATCKPDLVHIGTPVSYVQIYSKLRKNKGWVQNNLCRCIEIAQEKGMEVTVGFEDASRADEGYMISTAKLISKMGVKIVRIADTVGVLTPTRTKNMIQGFLNQVDIGVEIHTHNDLGMATANAIEGIKAGATYVDCTLGGKGERSGNCNLYDLLYAAERTFDFNMNKQEVRELEGALEALLKR